jgi:hypothetical protein
MGIHPAGDFDKKIAGLQLAVVVVQSDHGAILTKIPVFWNPGPGGDGPFSRTSVS